MQCYLKARKHQTIKTHIYVCVCVYIHTHMHIWLCIYREKYPYTKRLSDDLCVIIDMHSLENLSCLHNTNRKIEKY